MKTYYFVLLAALLPAFAHAQQFSQPTGSPFTTGGSPSGVATGDFNNDGKPDLAIANITTNNVTVLLGNGAGGFTAAPGSPFSVGTSPVSVAAGDCNGDGNLDLFVPNNFSNDVTVLLGNGSGGFTQAAGSPYTVGSGPHTVALADFNRDGHLDVAVANYDSANVSLLLGNGAGAFSVASSTFPTVVHPVSLVVGDLNKDGNPDLVTVSFVSGGGAYTVLLGNGVAGFTATNTSLAMADQYVSSVTISDLNGDGKVDLAMTSYDNSTLTSKILVLLGNGSGGFASAPGSPFSSPGRQAFSLAVSDFNGDGHLDLAVANVVSNDLTILRGDGSGGFFASSTSPFPLGTSPSVVVVGDWNKDGKPDLAISNTSSSNISILVNTTPNVSPQDRIGFFSNGYVFLDADGDGSFTGAPPDKYTLFLTPQPGDIAVTGDWNGDGRTKIGIYRNGFWLLDFNGNGVYDYDGTPTGDRFYGFGGPSSQGYIPVVGDWNGDGKTKVGFYYKGFWGLDYDGDGTFQSANDRFYGLGGRPNEIPIVGDWNHDGKTKVGSFSNGSFLLDLNGNGKYDLPSEQVFTFVPYTSADKPVVGDWNGNGFTKVGIFRNGFWILDYNGDGVYQSGLDKSYGFGGNPGETPVTGDWSGAGPTKIGIYINGFWILDYNGNGTFDGVSTDRFYAFGGNTGEQPLVGKWQ